MTKLKQHKNLLKRIQTYTFLNNNDKKSIEYTLKNRIHAIEISEKFEGIISDDKYVADEYCILTDFVSIGLWGMKHERTLSIPDNGKQPDSEWMLSIHFSTGPYILSREYVVEVFNLFFQELKDLGAAFCDSTNHHLLFYPRDAKKVYEAYPILLKKYRELAIESSKQAKRERLEKELRELE